MPPGSTVSVDIQAERARVGLESVLIGIWILFSKAGCFSPSPPIAKSLVLPLNKFLVLESRIVKC